MIAISENNSDSIRKRVAGFFENGGTLDKACAATPFPFEVRPQQQQMAEEVAKALVESEHLAVEAGTGIGKTFAYLIPAMLAALENSTRVAVSTHTINLQEQIIFKDLPFLLEHIGGDLKVALCKGRRNYLCRRRLESANLMSGDLFNKGAEKELARIRHWAEKTDDGSLSDFSEDDTQPAMAVWRQVCSEHDNCLGKKCHYYARCFLMKARSEAFNANLLVLNHHLLFSDLAMRQTGNGILPDCGALIIDEAHNIEDVAGEHLGLRLSQGGIQHWLRRLYTPAGGKGLLMALKEFQIADETARTWDAVDHFFIELSGLYAVDGVFDDKAPLPKSRGKRDKSCGARDKLTIKGRLELKSMLAEQVAVLVGHIQKLHEDIQDEAVKTELKAIIARGDEIRQAIEFFRKEPDPNFVYWIENEGGAPAKPAEGHGRPREARGRLALVSAPIDVTPLLKDMLFNAYSPIVMTSATLSVGGSLAYFRGRIGAENCRELIVDSPFNYDRQMKVYIAADMPDPNDAKFPEAVSNAVAYFARQSRGRAFVLFTNAELMRKVAASLESFFAEEGLTALIQGEGLPRHAMLKKFKAAYNPPEMQHENDQTKTDKAAVLFGLDSFWMGVDVPGEALSNVIIVRLPFAVPDEPLIKARVDRITASGGDAFHEYSLPQAILKFRQGVGRLIRTTTDEGMIVILDSRIITRRYGKHFLQAIPECPIEQVHIRDQIPGQDACPNSTRDSGRPGV